MAKGKYEYWLTEEGLTLLAGWARDGLSDVEMANNMGIAESTLYEWKKKYKQISETLKKNKEVPDYVVENSLYKRANGFEYTYSSQKVTRDGEVVNYEITTYFPPDPTSMIYWLKNRKPKKWRDRQDRDSGETLERLDQLLEEQKNA